MDTKQVDAFVEAVAPTLGGLAKDAANDAVKETNESIKKANSSIKEVEKEVLSIKQAIENHDSNTTEGQAKKAKDVIVNVFKTVKRENIQDEEAFKKEFDAKIKETYQNTVTPTDGAEFVFTQFQRDVYAVFESFPLLNELNTIQLAQGKSITIPTYDGGVEAYWVDEGGAFTSSKADTGTIKIDVYKLGALVTLTDEMLEDDMTNETLYNLIIQEAGVKFGKKIENAIINGDTKMKGILSDANLPKYASAATSFASVSDVDIVEADSLIGEEYDLNPNNKVAIMKKSTRNKLLVARDANGNILYPEVKDSGMIGDYRIVTARSMPDEASGAVAIILGNVADFYVHVNRQGFTAEMGYLADDFRTGKKSLRVQRRDGGAPKDINAFAAITIA